MNKSKASRFLVHGGSIAIVGLSSLLYSPMVAPLCAAEKKQVAAAAPAAPMPLLAAPEVSPNVLKGTGTVTITLPANFPLSTSRLQVGLFEAGRTGRIADIRRDFKVVNGRLQTSLNIQAEPGNYEIRLVSADKQRQPISEGASLKVPGILRTPGWWLLNGSPFISDGGPPTDAPNDLPFFISGLKRDLGGKAKIGRSSINLPSNTPLVWKTFPLPSVIDLADPKYDFGKLRESLKQQLAQAQARGERGYLGFALPASSWRIPGPTDAALKAGVQSLKAVLNELQPESALLFEFGTPYYLSVKTSVADQVAPLCDGIVVRGNTDETDTSLLIKIKNARRIAEEQPAYDLPIFVAAPARDSSSARFNATPDYLSLDLWMGGATAVLTGPEGRPAWAGVVERNLPLFAGSVTLEDLGFMPDSRIYDDFREARRIPLLARYGSGARTSESFAIKLESALSKDEIEQLRASASGGARIYIEGAPMSDKSGREESWQMSSLVGGMAERAKFELPPKGPPGTYWGRTERGTIRKNFSGAGDNSKPGDKAPEIYAKDTTMTLQDGWMFGTGRGLVVPVIQTVTVTVNKDTVAGQAKQQKGKDILTAPRVAATLADGSPALIINPVGKGEVVWMPHSPYLPIIGNLNVGARRKADAANKINTSPQNVDRSSAKTRYYASIADYMQPALIQVRGTNPEATGAEMIRVALRRSAKGCYILALFNVGHLPAPITASFDGVAGVALDLMNEQELPLSVRGFSSEATVTVPAHGYSLIAFAESRRALDEERNGAISQAKLK